MPLPPTGPEDDDWTPFVVALSIAAILTVGATLFLGSAVLGTPTETAEPAVPVLFGVALTACIVLGAELWAVSPLPGKTNPVYANEAEGENWTLYVGGLALAALMMFGVAALGIYLQFGVETGPFDTLSVTLIGVYLSAGTVHGARVLNLLYHA